MRQDLGEPRSGVGDAVRDTGVELGDLPGVQDEVVLAEQQAQAAGEDVQLTNGGYDLVSSQFMHLPGEARLELFTRLAAAVAPGGTLLIVGHHPSDLPTAHRMPFPDMSFTSEEVAASLDPTAWDVLAADTRPRAAVGPDARHRRSAPILF